MTESFITQEKILENMKATYSFAVQKSSSIGSFLLDKTKQFYSSQSVTEKLGQAKQVYQNNKAATCVLGLSLASLVFYKIRNRNKRTDCHKEDASIKQLKGQQNGPRKNIDKLKITNKIFMDEQVGDQYIDEQSTDTFLKSNSIKKGNKHHVWNRNVRYQSDNQSEEQKQDKIFFQMFQTYRCS